MCAINHEPCRLPLLKYLIAEEIVQREMLTEKGLVVKRSDESERNTCEIIHHARLLVKKNGLSVKLADRDGSWHKYFVEKFIS